MPRDQIDFTGALRWERFTLGLRGSWRGDSRSRRLFGVDGSDDLLLDSYATVQASLSFPMGRATATELRAEGERRPPGPTLQFEIDNLFDARPRANLGDGRPAPGYGPDEQDPLGRTLRVFYTRRL